MVIENLIFLQTFAGYSGSGFGRVLWNLQQAGVFSYVLPFLIIFALVFGILSRVNLFGDNKAINSIIALSVGLLSLQFNKVTVFFSEIFPKLGIGLSVILVVLILLSAFIDWENSKFIVWGLSIFGILVFLVILYKTVGYAQNIYSWISINFGDFFEALLFLVLLIGVVIAASSEKKAKIRKPEPKIKEDALKK